MKNQNEIEKELLKGCGKRNYKNYLSANHLVKCSNLELCSICEARLEGFKKGKASKQKDVLKILDEIDNPYPIDVFPKITKEQFSQISNYLETIQGFPLDRLSAHLMRIARNNLKEELTQKISKEIK